MRAPALYRALLRLLPRRLRERHRAAMEADFADALAEARASGSSVEPGLVWVSGAWDVARRAIYERARGVAGSRVGGWNPLADLQFAARGFLRQPGITFLAVMMLSLGVAASTAVFTLADGVFLRPLPFPDADRLVYLNETAPSWNLERTGILYDSFDTWRQNVETFEAMGLYSYESYNLSAGGGADRVYGLAVTWDFAPALGVEPQVGRLFTAGDDRPGAEPVGFGGSRDVVGRYIRVDGKPRTVIGFLPPAATFPTEVQLWTPLAVDPEEGHDAWMYEGIGRLKPGVTVAAAREDLERVHGPIWETFDPERVVSPIAVPLREEMTSRFRGVGLALGLAVGLVLLIACANVASILLARSFARRRELAVRVALGADTRRIARQLLAESLALALVACPLGLVLGFWGVGALASAAPEGLPAWMELAPSWRMALFGVALIGFTTVLFGWAPVMQARRSDVAASLGEGSVRAGASRGQRRTMNGLVVAEITLAAVLLVGGGLLVRTSRSLHDIDPGFRTTNVLGFRVARPDATYPDSVSRVVFYRRLVSALERLPGVRGVGGITCPPLGCHSGAFFAAEGGLGMDPDDPNPVVLYRIATPGYFEAMGIEPLHGRVLSPEDGREGRRSVVVNQTFARRFFPDTEDPVGRRVVPRGQDLDGDGYRVVGVARDTRHYGVDTPPRPGLYFPYEPFAERSLALFLWTDVDAEALAGPAREAVHALDPELPLFQVGTTAQAVRDSLAERRAIAWSMVVFAGLALLLALGGIYGVLSYVVGQRVREIGVRIALGATRRRVLGLVVRDGLVLAGAGFALSLPLAVVAGVLLRGLLAGVSPFDPIAYGTTGAVIGVTVILAALVPARRAMTVEPGSALRTE
ncbi:MAG: ABC transporter permease [Gemmatimonadota bacterium]